MKKIIVVLCLLVGMAGAVSAQKKEMLALTEEIINLLRLLHGLETNLAASLQTPQEA